jgi:hypothetical protein
VIADRQVVKALGTVRGAVTAAATVITAVLGVVFLLIPSWRPLSRDKIEASVSVIALEHDVPLEEWARRQYPGDPKGALRKLLGHPINDNDRAVTGLVLYVRLQADGFKRRSIRLRPRVYDAKTRRPPEDADFQSIYPETGRLKIDAPSRSSIQLILLDSFSGIPGRYFVRVEAYDSGGILAFDDSEPFRGP